MIQGSGIPYCPYCLHFAVDFPPGFWTEAGTAYAFLDCSDVDDDHGTGLYLLPGYCFVPYCWAGYSPPPPVCWIFAE